MFQPTLSQHVSSQYMTMHQLNTEKQVADLVYQICQNALHFIVINICFLQKN